MTQTALVFSGPDLQPSDHARLGKQLARIVSFMADGKWRTLAEVSAATGAPEASASAQIRHVKREKFGASTVERERVGGGLYRYRMQVSPATRALLEVDVSGEVRPRMRSKEASSTPPRFRDLLIAMARSESKT